VTKAVETCHVNNVEILLEYSCSRRIIMWITLWILWI